MCPRGTACRTLIDLDVPGVIYTPKMTLMVWNIRDLNAAKKKREIVDARARARAIDFHQIQDDVTTFVGQEETTAETGEQGSKPIQELGQVG